jgi:hypothetical protein
VGGYGRGLRPSRLATSWWNASTSVGLANRAGTSTSTSRRCCPGPATSAAAGRKNRLAGFVPNEALILWLAHKEAKALIGFDAAPPGKQ